MVVLMEWYSNILHKIVGDYFKKQDKNPFLAKKNIDQTIQALKEIFEDDGKIPLETLIGLIHSTFNLLNTMDKLTTGEISQKVLGYAIIFAKTAYDEQDIWTSDFAQYHPINNIETLQKYEIEALKQLKFSTHINLSVVQKFECILNECATHEDKLQLAVTIGTFGDKELLGDLFKNLCDQVSIPNFLISRLLTQEILIDKHIKNGEEEAKLLPIPRL
jgi:hypothetical protein